MTKRVTRDDCLERAYALLDNPWDSEGLALKAIAWIELAKQLERKSLRVEE